MAKSGKFYHATTNNNAVAAVGTSFNAGKNHKHELVYPTTSTNNVDTIL